MLRLLVTSEIRHRVGILDPARRPIARRRADVDEHADLKSFELAMEQVFRLVSHVVVGLGRP